jgi:hypothetical protein
MRTKHLLNVIIQSVCAMSFLLATSHPAAGAPLPVPERGFISVQPATIWEEGLICGNGTIGANALSRPLNERIIFTHERLFMPMGAPVMPPDQSARLFEIRGLIERGLYRQATELQFNLSGQSSFLYPDFFVPAFDLTIGSTHQGVVRDYSRSVDFQTGETAVRWSDDRGAFERRMFVSRADGVAVLVITGPKPGSLDCRLALEPREPSDQFNDDSDIAKRSDQMFKEHVGDIKSTASSSSLTYSNRYLKAYPGSIHALEGFARVIATGGTTEAGTNGALVIKGADRVLIFVDLRPIYDPDKPEMNGMEAALAKLPDDYGQLLQRHAKLHGEWFNRMRLDLGGGADHWRTTEELLAESTYEKPNRALIEKEFDAARYNIISCTGKLPPNLQGVWGGTYVPGWASDYTHNEWLTPRLANNDSHRHSSQLYPLYDGMPDEIARHPELRAAFRRSIEFKLDNHWQNNQRGFMSFGLVQLGQAAASLGDEDLAYRCLTQLVNRFWLNNLASMHNHRSLFNMDISGGMPAVIIKMLVASDPGRLQLLPALPKAWPTGTIEGVLCRGQIDVRRLHWNPDGLECTLRSIKAQTVLLELPDDISAITLEGQGAKVAKADSTHQRKLMLPAKEEVTVKISRKR